MYCTGFLRGVLPVHYEYTLALVGRTLRREEGMLLLGCIVIGFASGDDGLVDAIRGPGRSAEVDRPWTLELSFRGLRECRQLSRHKV